MYDLQVVCIIMAQQPGIVWTKGSPLIIMIEAERENHYREFPTPSCEIESKPTPIPERSDWQKSVCVAVP
jgi:hypothetical protein